MKMVAPILWPDGCVVLPRGSSKFFRRPMSSEMKNHIIPIPSSKKKP